MNFTIGHPPFDYDLNTNGINAVDGRNRTIIPGRRYMGAVSGITSTESIPKYLLESSIKITPSIGSGRGHDALQVTGRDFVAGKSGETQGYAGRSASAACLLRYQKYE